MPGGATGRGLRCLPGLGVTPRGRGAPAWGASVPRSPGPHQRLDRKTFQLRGAPDPETASTWPRTRPTPGRCRRREPWLGPREAAGFSGPWGVLEKPRTPGQRARTRAAFSARLLWTRTRPDPAKERRRVPEPGTWQECQPARTRANLTGVMGLQHQEKPRSSPLTPAPRAVEKFLEPTAARQETPIGQEASLRD